MSRDLDSGSSAALQSNVIRPVLIARLEILSDPVTSWTGPNTLAPSGTGDAALDGELFTPIAPFFSLSDINEDQSNGGPVTLTLSGNDVDETALRQIVRDKRKWQGRKAYLWLGLLSADESSLSGVPVRIKTAVMTSFNVSRKEDQSIVTVTIDDDLGNSSSAPFRIIDHSRLYPADTFSGFLIQLGNKPGGIESGDLHTQQPDFPADAYIERDFL